MVAFGSVVVLFMILVADPAPPPKSAAAAKGKPTPAAKPAAQQWHAGDVLTEANLDTYLAAVVPTLQKRLEAARRGRVSRRAPIEATVSIIGPGPASRHTVSFWLRGAVVKGFRDDQTFKTIPGTYRFAGNTTYETVVGGSRTVALFEEYDLTPRLKRLAGRPAP